MQQQQQQQQSSSPTGRMPSSPVTAEELARIAAALSAQQAQQGQQQQQPGGGAQGAAPAAAGGAAPSAGQAQPAAAGGPPAMVPLATTQPAPPAGEAPAAAGSGGSGGAAADDPADSEHPSPPPPVFISWVERKVLQHGVKPSKKAGGSTGHAYIVRFYLVDAEGGEHLAAEGEDQGDAHYLYTNMPSFPFLHCHNKQDVVSWLEDLQERSKVRAGLHSEVVLDEAKSVTDPRQIRLPVFVAFRHEKFEYPDGRHGMRWFLIDRLAHEHLAITGEEKETRDGHYTYCTAGVFRAIRPLECGNQGEVARWLDAMIVPHHTEGQGPLAGKATPGVGPTLSGGRPARSDSSARGRAGGGSKAGSKKGGGGSHRGGGTDLFLHATTNLKRKAQAAAAAAAAGGAMGVVSAFASPSAASVLADAEVREAAVGELKKWAQEEAVKREGTKRAALGFLSDGAKDGDAQTLTRSLDVVNRAALQPAQLPSSSQAATHKQLLWLVEVLGALRALAHMYVPLRVMMSQPALMQALGALRKHQNAEVSGLAEGLLQQWLRTLAAHTAVLTDPQYVQDPRKALAAKLDDPSELERLVAEVTRQGAQQQGGEGAALGAGLPGLAATPSEVSLAMLDDALDAAAGAAAAAAGDVTRTVERRRLDLTEAGTDVDAEAASGPAAPKSGPQQQQQQLVASAFGAAAAQAGDMGAAAVGAGPAANGPSMKEAPSQALLLEAPLPMEMDGQLLG